MLEDFTAQVVTIYCLCDDFLKAVGHRDDPQTQMNTAEVMTVALVAAARFASNQESSRLFLKDHGYVTAMLSKSRFNRRLHSVPEAVWQGMLWLLSQAAQHIHEQRMAEQTAGAQAPDVQEPYIVDSCPVPVCHNIRIRRCRLYRGEQHRGYCASKRSYYFGLKVHLLVSSTGQPVEFVLTPAAEGDINGLRRLPLNLPDGADLVADAAYTDYGFEDDLEQDGQITLTADRRKNSKRPHPPWRSYWCKQSRRQIETTFSTITDWMGKRLRAVTPRGFELKIGLTILAYAILV
jgi:transposase